MVFGALFYKSALGFFMPKSDGSHTKAQEMMKQVQLEMQSSGAEKIGAASGESMAQDNQSLRPNV